METILREEEVTYKNALELIDRYLEEAIKDNYPIKHNAEFILEMMKMQSGIRKLLHPFEIGDVPESAFIVIDKGIIGFSFIDSFEKNPDDDREFLEITTKLVFFSSNPFVFYIITQHDNGKEKTYGYQYFNVDQKESIGYKEIPADLSELFEPQTDMTDTIQKVKEISYQINA